jgi:hypothetical protein
VWVIGNMIAMALVMAYIGSQQPLLLHI